MSAFYNYRNDRFVSRERPQITASTGAIVCCAGYGKTSYLRQLAAENKDSVLIGLAPYHDSAKAVAALFEPHISDSSACSSEYDVFRLFIDEFSGQDRLLLLDNADTVNDKTAAALLRLLCEASAEGRFRLLAAGRSVPELSRNVRDR